LLISQPKKVLVLLLAALTLAGCSSRGVKHGTSEKLDSAIALYIGEHYEEAIEALVELTSRLESEGDLQTAYLYLGRSYMSLGDYVKAADAFSSGIILGGGIEFEQHLEAAQQHLRSTPRITGTQPSITRGQLAALIDNLFGKRIESSRSAPTSSDMENHWAKAYVARVAAAGVMEPLADGAFHPDAVVTYPAFYVTLLRLGVAASIADTAIAAQFPNGFHSAFAAEERTARDNRYGVLDGGEATKILESLEKASE